jgi:hypothetical protein
VGGIESWVTEGRQRRAEVSQDDRQAGERQQTSGISRSLSEMAISKMPLALCVSPTLISSCE